MAHETMAIEGTLDLFQLPEILQLVSHQGKTGILTVQGETDIVAISFDRGRVVAADALNQTLEDALGSVLAGQGLVAPQAFAEVAAEHRAGRGRLMDLLVDRGLVARRELLDALRVHTYGLLIELLRWRQGEFKFYTGDEVSYEDGFQPIAVEELLIRSVEEAAGEGHPAIPDARSIYEPAPLDRPIHIRREGEDISPPDASALWLTSVEMDLLEQLQGGYSVAALVRKTGLDEYRVRYGLHRLLETGAARRRVVVAPPPPVLVVEPEPVLRPLLPDPADVTASPEDAAVLLPPPPRTEVARSGHVVTAWPGRAMALLPVLLVVVSLFRWPLWIALPVPWQAGARQGMERELVRTAHRQIDRAAKTYYLLTGHFPERLENLGAYRLLAPRQLDDPLGRSFSWMPALTSYELAPATEGFPDSQLGLTEAISGNFLLDPEFLNLAKTAGQKPLVLLD